MNRGIVAFLALLPGCAAPAGDVDVPLLWEKREADGRAWYSLRMREGGEADVRREPSALRVEVARALGGAAGVDLAPKAATGAARPEERARLDALLARLPAEDWSDPAPRSIRGAHDFDAFAPPPDPGGLTVLLIRRSGKPREFRFHPGAEETALSEGGTVLEELNALCLSIARRILSGQ